MSEQTNSQLKTVTQLGCLSGCLPLLILWAICVPMAYLLDDDLTTYLLLSLPIGIGIMIGFAWRWIWLPKEIQKAVIQLQNGELPTAHYPVLLTDLYKKQMEQIAQFLVISENHSEQVQKGLQRSAVQESQHRLARDLHDAVKQQMFAVRTSAWGANKLFDKNRDRSYQALQDVIQSSERTLVELDGLLLKLTDKAFTDTALLQKIQLECDTLAHRTDAEVRFLYDEGIASGELTPHSAENLLRIVQEALANIAKHARATEVTVLFQQTGKHLHVTIQDNGVGFDKEQAIKGMGLHNLEQRSQEIGATFHLQSNEEGTRITIQNIA